MLAMAVVPAGFYIGLSWREAEDDKEREIQRLEDVIQRRTMAKVEAAEANRIGPPRDS